MLDKLLNRVYIKGEMKTKGKKMLQIIDNKNQTIESRTWKFNKRNINAIASEYDAVVERFDIDGLSATLKDSRGRLIFIDGHGYLRNIL